MTLLRRLRPTACLGVLLAALAFPSVASAALPPHGVLVPGTSLGGLSLGMSSAQVKAHWGAHYGRCRNCFRETWYYTYRPFQPQGAGVVFERGKVVQLYTLWQPEGWRTARGLTLGAREQELTTRYGTLIRVSCGRYTAQILHGPSATTVFYVYSGAVWGFGLMPPKTSPCL